MVARVLESALEKKSKEGHRRKGEVKTRKGAGRVL